jgi:methyl-accepting chemotaxis protein
MKTMTLKMKLTALLGAALVAMALLCISQWRNASNQRALAETMEALDESSALVLELRKHEKDFLLRSDLKYEAEFSKTLEEVTKRLGDLNEGMQEYGLNTSEVDTFIQALKAYGAAFRATVTAMKAVGLNHNSGLQGELRKSVHEVQAALEAGKNVGLIKDLLVLRRDEKDFLLRMDTKYAALLSG